MLNQKYRLKKKSDFDIVFRKGQAITGRFIFLKIIKNQLDNSRFGFIVSLKVSKKAVIRNRIKRRLREIIKKKIKDIKTNYDIIILAKPEIISKDYKEIEKEIILIFKKASLL